jgi:uncharacterized protein YndB with AHSA1/START domain
VAPACWDHGEVRQFQSHAWRLLPPRLDVHRPNWRSGKSSADSDIVEARYVDIVPNGRVVQAVDFASDDPAFAPQMIMTWAVQAVEGGTRVEITAADVPDGVSVDDHAAGLASSLDNLARYVGP